MELFEGKVLWKKRSSALQEVDAVEALRGKSIILLYFGHSICERGMTFLSYLKDLQKAVKLHKFPVDIVYTSTERDRESFKKHFLGDHGDWLCLPCGDEMHLLLEYRFMVVSTPKVVVIEKSGVPITVKGYPEIFSKGINALRSWMPPDMP
ncbi:nucleoredoxin-like protein 2 [Ischnura elegans]|uniref:nucleoredoxin-like protein 2 n=1 Tax=Ischnura elegans TaxID=197161 RepID=UPI001ED881DC|nr:nucleoredoxin-like protein 2 [Ischnura elegans]